MPINITMPALSPTMEEGNLAKWLVKEGDKVKSGDVIAEIETDKATMEVEAVDEGTVAKIVVPAGTEGVKVNAVIAVLAADGEDAGAAAKGGGGAPAKAEAPKAEPPKAEAPQKEARAAPKTEAEAAAARGHCSQRRLRAHRRQIGGSAATFASPLARRIAKDAGVDVARGQRHRPAWPRRQGRRRGGNAGRRRQGCAGGQAGAPALHRGCSAAKAMSDEAVLKLFERGLLRARAARQHAQDHRPPAGRGEDRRSRIST